MILDQKALIASIEQIRDPSEENLRRQLAYLYRIFDYYQWCDLIVTHLSVRVPNEDALLINPFGLIFSEVTADNLVKVDFDGNIIESRLGFANNRNGTTVHRAIYRAYPEVNCILHTHSHNGVAVSSLAENLMLLDQIGMMFYGKVGYHDFETLFINDDKQEHLMRDLKGKQCLILRNHGLLAVGKNIPEAFWFYYYLEYACKIQVLTMSTGGKIKPASDEAIQQTATKYDVWREKNEHMPVSDSELLFAAAKRLIGNI
jgi:ribulose-5-phosphate 4-epimerase/fuculose-1-phosphate aldolase